MRSDWLVPVVVGTGALSLALWQSLGSVQGQQTPMLSSPTLHYSGTGEDWLLNPYSRPTASEAQGAWSSYLTDPTFQQWKQKFGWNAVRLGFNFANMYKDSPGNNLDASSPNTADILLLDQIVQLCHDDGFKVLLGCFNFTGASPLAGPTTNPYWPTQPTPTDLSNWYIYWTNLATHFAGDTRLAIYEIANELRASTETNTVLQTLTSDIRSVDPTRPIAWWVYSPSSLTGTGTYANCPIIPNPGNMYIDLHPATYTLPSGCQSLTTLQNQLNGLLKFSTNCGYAPLIGEINAQNSMCNSVTISYLEAVFQTPVSWFPWGYSLYTSMWDTVFAALPAIGQILTRVYVGVKTNPAVHGTANVIAASGCVDQNGKPIQGASMQFFIGGTQVGGTYTTGSTGYVGIPFTTPVVAGTYPCTCKATFNGVTITSKNTISLVVT